MSTVRLKKDWNNKKPGEVVSVPFLVGKQLIAAGTAEYPAATVRQPKPAPKPPVRTVEVAKPAPKPPAKEESPNA